MSESEKKPADNVPKMTPEERNAVRETLKTITPEYVGKLLTGVGEQIARLDDAQRRRIADHATTVIERNPGVLPVDVVLDDIIAVLKATDTRGGYFVADNSGALEHVDSRHEIPRVHRQQAEYDLGEER
jgi:hypothetical protein